MNYKGFKIVQSNSRGGKAGRGCNKTATIQVHEDFNATSYLMIKQITFTVGNEESRQKAVQKARDFIDKLPPKVVKAPADGTGVIKDGESKAAS
jgi:hypothetical protein